MKSNLHSGYFKAMTIERAKPKILFKFGVFHVYKGFNQLHNNDLGNYVSELADGDGDRPVHVLVSLHQKREGLQSTGAGAKEWWRILI
jgi:hypothetical protein